MNAVKIIPGMWKRDLWENFTQDDREAIVRLAQIAPDLFTDSGHEFAEFCAKYDGEDITEDSVL
jgi:hypothetical protein